MRPCVKSALRNLAPHMLIEKSGLRPRRGCPSRSWQSVFATLFCEAAAPFTLHNTTLTGVALKQDGDFEIDDVLTPVSGDCASPVLLIRNVAGVWFAAGIPSAEKHHD
jgi:hypothetical protein